MINKSHDGNTITYTSDNGRRAIVKHYRDHIDIQTYYNGNAALDHFETQEEATQYLREFMHALPMQDFLLKYKGMVNQKGLAQASGRSVNYMSHIATGRRSSSDELNKAIEKAVRELGEALSTINII